jgi:two-component system invasion response regulator UvrY
MIKVIMVDDHVAVRRGLEKILEQEPDMELVEEAISGAEFMELLKEMEEEEYDVVVLDITLPDRSGLEVLKDVKAMYPGLPVLILSIHSEERYAQKAREAGAAGYLTKYRASDEVADAIRKVASGGEYFSRSPVT